MKYLLALGIGALLIGQHTVIAQNRKAAEINKMSYNQQTLYYRCLSTGTEYEKLCNEVFNEAFGVNIK
jgi:hypothetical protein